MTQGGAIAGGLGFMVKYMTGFTSIIGCPRGNSVNGDFLTIAGRLECLGHACAHTVLALPSGIVAFGGAVIIPWIIAKEFRDDYNNRDYMRFKKNAREGGQFEALAVIGILGFPLLHCLGLIRSLLGVVIHPAIYLN